MMITLSIVLLLSIALNVLTVWYISKMLKKLLFISDNIGELLGIVEEYGEHLSNVHEMEMFYGEPVLQNLMQHSKFVTEYTKKYRDIYELTEGDLPQDGDEEFEEEEEIEQ
jgi:hypothetical protein